jgi:hypothetical protein
VELYDNGKTSLRRPSTWKKPFHRASTPTPPLALLKTKRVDGNTIS